MNILECLDRFYCLPLNQVFSIMLCLGIIWTVIIRFLKCKVYRKWKIFNIVLCFFSFLLIMKMTLWGRSVGTRELELRPFYTFTTISYNNEAFRTLLMNVILFVPFGLTFPYVIDAIMTKVKVKGYRWILCVVIGFLLSVVLEVLQYCFKLGRAETDDIICNTIGCMLGVMANVAGYWWRNRYVRM